MIKADVLLIFNTNGSGRVSCNVEGCFLTDHAKIKITESNHRVRLLVSCSLHHFIFKLYENCLFFKNIQQNLSICVRGR